MVVLHRPFSVVMFL